MTGAARWLIVILSVLLAASILTPLAVQYVRRAEAREVLRRCKTLELAVVAASAECRSTGLSIGDAHDPHGFAEGMEERVRTLSGCTGEIFLIDWDAATGKVERLYYTEGEYGANFDAAAQSAWTVVHMTPMIPAS